jgi:hypothetical protein
MLIFSPKVESDESFRLVSNGFVFLCSTMAGDLEDGEIEDGEIPDEELVSGREAVNNEPEGSASQPSGGPGLLSVQSDTTTPDVKPQISSSKLKCPVPDRSGSAVNHRHVDSLKESAVEDDWAGDVEKAIKAAMSSTDSGQELNAKVNASGGGGGVVVKAEDDDERKSRRKKRKKKHREDDEERKEAKVNLKEE